MRPVIIGVGGSCSGVGKTHVICRILQSFQGWGAIKYTKTPFYSSVTDDIKVLSKQGKDTKRYLDAGAGKVVWVQSPHQELTEALSLAVGMLSEVKGIIIEGNSAIEVLQPDIVIFVAGERKQSKESAGNILRMAHFVLSGKEAPLSVEKNTREFSRDEENAFMNSLREMIREKMTGRENREGISGE